ncbi:MAG: small acid-soluble spore protein SspI [Bacilli bacterium]|nr:small acid-soluble spore protein SspI [Bacilli bacterium]
MNISIRSHIFNNFKDSTKKDIRLSIDEAVKDEDEITLPGLGVFFEVLWDSSSNDKKNEIVESLYSKLKKNN